jgi:transcription initiation factor TFIID subunit 11
LIQPKLNQPIPPSILIIISGCAKMFIGEMVESAIEVMAEWGDTGSIRPKHLREAYRRSRNQKGNLYKKRLFN